MSAKKNVVIVDDHPVMREGLKSMVQSETCCDVPVSTGSADEARQWIRENRPDLVILDPELQKIDGLVLSKDLLETNPDIPILIVSRDARYERIVSAFRTGVKGYAVKDSSLADLKYGVLRVLDGGYFIDGYAAEVIVSRLVGQKTAAGDFEDEQYASLTRREKEILRLLSEGLSNRAVAENLAISAKTVSNHRANLMKKLDIESYPEMVRYACRIGLIEPDLWEKA